MDSLRKATEETGAAEEPATENVGNPSGRVSVSSDHGVEAVSSLMESVNFPGKAVWPPPPPEAQPPNFITRQTAAVVKGIHTDIVVQVFSDRVFIVITQTNKVGTMVSSHLSEVSLGLIVCHVLMLLFLCAAPATSSMRRPRRIRRARNLTRCK